MHQDQLLLHIYECFAGWLAQGHASDEAADMDSDQQPAGAPSPADARAAQLRAFVRHYFSETACIADELSQGLFARERTAADVREAFVKGLRLVAEP